MENQRGQNLRPHSFHPSPICPSCIGETEAGESFTAFVCMRMSKSPQTRHAGAVWKRSPLGSISFRTSLRTANLDTSSMFWHLSADTSRTSDSGVWLLSSLVNEVGCLAGIQTYCIWLGMVSEYFSKAAITFVAFLIMQVTCLLSKF